MIKRLVIAFGLLALVLLWLVASLYPNLLWFENLGFLPIFWTVLLSKIGCGFVVWLVFILIISLNLYLARRLNPVNGPEIASKAEGGYFSQLGLSGKALHTVFLGLILLISFGIASKGSSQWNMVLRYLYQQPFGGTDPIFSRDIGFMCSLFHSTFRSKTWS